MVALIYIYIIIIIIIIIRYKSEDAAISSAPAWDTYSHLEKVTGRWDFQGWCNSNLFQSISAICQVIFAFHGGTLESLPGKMPQDTQEKATGRWDF